MAVIGGNVIFGFSFLFSKVALDIVEPIVLILKEAFSWAQIIGAAIIIVSVTLAIETKE